MYLWKTLELQSHGPWHKRDAEGLWSRKLFGNLYALAGGEQWEANLVSG